MAAREHHPVIKVKRAELIRSIGARIRELNAEHQAKKAKYPKDVTSFCESAATQLEKFAARLRKGEMGDVESSYRDYVDFRIKGSKPQKPHMEGEICRMKGDLERLKLSEQDVLSLRTNSDLLVYLDGTVCRNGDED